MPLAACNVDVVELRASAGVVGDGDAVVRERIERDWPANKTVPPVLFCTRMPSSVLVTVLLMVMLPPVLLDRWTGRSALLVRCRRCR